MKNNDNAVPLKIKTIAYDKFVENEAVQIFLRLAYAYVKKSLDKEKGSHTDEDVEKIKWLASLVDAFEVLNDDIGRLYAENAALVHLLEQECGKPCKIVFEHKDRE